MGNAETRVEIAAAAISELTAIHQRFFDEIAKQVQTPHKAGSLKLEGDRLSGVCLGIPFRVVHRPVSRNGELAAKEYAFLVHQGKDELPIWHLYLEGNGTLHTDSGRKNRFCDFNNSYVVTRIIVAVSEVLLSSSVFKPSA